MAWKPAAAKPAAPFLQAEGAHVAGIAQLLEAVDRLACRAVGHDVVDHGEDAAGAQDARGFGQEAVDVREVVRCDATGDEIEFAAGKGQILGVGALQRDVVDAFLRGERGGDGQHLRREVRGGNMGDMRREGKGRVPGCRGDVEYAPVRSRRDQLDEARQAGALGVDGAGRIGLSVRAELPAHEVFGHRGLLKNSKPQRRKVRKEQQTARKNCKHRRGRRARREK